MAGGSLFGSGQPATESTTTLEREATDLNLEIVTIDKMYDLTLIVGTPEPPMRQKAFRVNKGSFRNASEVWTAMLSGNWVESDLSEISFPEDSPYAFEIVLRIAHLQFHKQPASLTQEQLVEIATLSDKYDLGRVICAAAELKKWLQPYKGSGTLWPADIDHQDFALITAAFGLEEDSQYLVNRLAMDIRVEEGSYYYIAEGTESNKIHLRPDLPAGIVGECCESIQPFRKLTLRFSSD
jgi:hypothetical protein